MRGSVGLVTVGGRGRGCGRGLVVVVSLSCRCRGCSRDWCPPLTPPVHLPAPQRDPKEPARVRLLPRQAVVSRGPVSARQSRAFHPERGPSPTSFPSLSSRARLTVPLQGQIPPSDHPLIALRLPREPKPPQHALPQPRGPSPARESGRTRTRRRAGTGEERGEAGV